MHHMLQLSFLDIQVYVVKPKGFWQRQKTGMNFQLKKSKFNFTVVMLEHEGDLFHYLQLSQITKELGGALSYTHEEWLETQGVWRGGRKRGRKGGRGEGEGEGGERGREGGEGRVYREREGREGREGKRFHACVCMSSGMNTIGSELSASVNNYVTKFLLC